MQENVLFGKTNLKRRVPAGHAAASGLNACTLKIIKIFTYKNLHIIYSRSYRQNNKILSISTQSYINPHLK
jgi:hypothetical protein